MFRNPSACIQRQVVLMPTDFKPTKFKKSCLSSGSMPSSSSSLLHFSCYFGMITVNICLLVCSIVNVSRFFLLHSSISVLDSGNKLNSFTDVSVDRCKRGNISPFRNTALKFSIVLSCRKACIPTLLRSSTAQMQHVAQVIPLSRRLIAVR